MEVAIARVSDGYELASPAGTPEHLPDDDALARRVAQLEAEHAPRWVWADTSRIYPGLLQRGVRVERVTDLRLTHRILRTSVHTAASAIARAEPGPWDTAAAPSEHTVPSLFDEPGRREPTLADVRDEAERQEEAVREAAQPERLGLLLRAESAGALIAAELHHAGLPWSAEVHQRHLAELLGPRPPAGQRPEKLQRLAEQITAALGAAELNPDSPTELLKALRRNGIDVRSTRKWELHGVDHPVAEPLLEYKRLSRLHTANGWAWLDTWVTGGRFHPVYVPGGVVTGRWATDGGGALQLPKALRAAIVAAPGNRLVVADVAQLEPRILAAMSADPAMIAACRAPDLYQAFVDAGVVSTRQQAKIGMLAAMYGGTSGDAAEVLPRLRQRFGRAVALVDEAARAGERFERVSTWLGRTSPAPGDSWLATQQIAYGDDADDTDRQRARSQGRSWGRFTRNFVVQGTAAEWALCWMASLRRRLRGLGEHAELVYFLHDEVIVEASAAIVDAVVEALDDSARQATRLLFGSEIVSVPLAIDAVEDYGQAR